MTLLFLVVLAAAWGIVFLPAVRRARESSPYPSTLTFKRAMHVASPKTPCGRWASNPRSAPTSASLRRNRRLQRIFALGLVAVGLSALLALFNRGGWTELHLAIDGSMCGYVAWLLEMKRRRVERGTKVRSLPKPQPVPVYLSELQTGT